MLALTRPLSRLQANRLPTNMNQIFPLQQNNTNQCRFIFVSKCLTILFGSSIKKIQHGFISNISPSTTVLCHFLLYTQSTFSSEHLCPPLQSHFLVHFLPNYSPPFAQHAQTILTFLSVSCSQHIQCPNGSRVLRFHLLKTLHTSFLQSSRPSST